MSKNLANLLVAAKPFEAPTEAHQEAWTMSLAELQKLDPAMVDSFLVTVLVKVGTFKCDHCDKDHDDTKQIIAAGGSDDFLPALAAAAIGSIQERMASETPDENGIFAGNDIQGVTGKSKNTH